MDEAIPPKCCLQPLFESQAPELIRIRKLTIPGVDAMESLDRLMEGKGNLYGLRENRGLIGLQTVTNRAMKSPLVSREHFVMSGHQIAQVEVAHPAAFAVAVEHHLGDALVEPRHERIIGDEQVLTTFACLDLEDLVDEVGVR